MHRGSCDTIYDRDGTIILFLILLFEILYGSNDPRREVSFPKEATQRKKKLLIVSLRPDFRVLVMQPTQINRNSKISNVQATKLSPRLSELELFSYT